ncbi:MAG: hypothetical protein ACK46X_14750 [Candidatus Sericytochromatia bacterium]
MTIATFGDSLSEQMATWIDDVTDGVGGHALAATKLVERHRRYYARRVPGLDAPAATWRWAGCCPFCGGGFEVDALTGWWSCGGCYRRGEAYALEFQLFGRQDARRWEACQQEADWLMNG